MNNREFYKNIMSDVQPSEQSVERIMDMANTENKKRNIIKPVLAVAACAAIFVTGIFAGGKVYSGKTAVDKLNTVNTSESSQKLSNLFLLKAYAAEEVQSITESGKVTMQKSKLEAYYDDGAYTVEMSGESKFEVSGNNIKSVRYQCENGSFGGCVDFNKMEYLKKQNKYYDAVIPYSADFDKLSVYEFSETVFKKYENGEYDSFFKEKKPVSEYLKVEKKYDGDRITGVGFVSVETYQSVSSGNSCKDFTYTNCAGSDVFLNYVEWKPDMSELFDGKGNPSGAGFDELRHDKLTVTVEFNDGSVQIQSYNLGFNKNGNLEIQKIF